MLLVAPANGKSVEIDVDTSLAARVLDIACSGTTVKAPEFASSQVLKRQLAHHSRFGSDYTFETYVEGLETISRCRAPEPDPFRFSAMVERRDVMERAIRELASREQKLGGEAAALILPYVPESTNWRGDVVLAPASLSCGGFAIDDSFFIDLPCIAQDVDGNYEALVRLVAHESYHDVQSEFMPQTTVEFDAVSTPTEAQEFVLRDLASEGSASFVADMRTIGGDGSYAVLSRETAQRNYRHLDYNFRLLGYVLELLSQPHPAFATRFRELYGLAFDGAFGEHSYFVGQQMSAEIVHDYGAAALPCVLSLPPENFVFAYAQAYSAGTSLKESQPLPVAVLGAARNLRESRTTQARLGECLQRQS